MLSFPAGAFPKARFKDWLTGRGGEFGHNIVLLITNSAALADDGNRIRKMTAITRHLFALRINIPINPLAPKCCGLKSLLKLSPMLSLLPQVATITPDTFSDHLLVSSAIPVRFSYPCLENSNYLSYISELMVLIIFEINSSKLWDFFLFFPRRATLI